ncbi:MAG: GGDEF domain-containing protein [Burkholderiales bacterium]|nr:GGDEF domain-containing protein [Burkholderiales bacterium]
MRFTLLSLSPRRLARVAGPYLLLWVALACAIIGLAWHEIAATRELADVRLEAGNLPAAEFAALAALESRVRDAQRRHARALAAFAVLALAALTLPIALAARRALWAEAHRTLIEEDVALERGQERTDALTGVANRRGFEEALAACHADLAERRQPFVLASVDIDRFRRLNDTRGKATGDQALKRVARTLATTIRRSDLIARLGGDEFAVLMPNADGRAMRRPFNAMFTALTVAMAGEGWPVSFSIGVVAFETPSAAPQEASLLADKLMATVKASGRNGVRFAVYRGGKLYPDPGLGSADEDIAV